MFKKNFRDIYLIGISFIAGILFIVQCGGVAPIIAQAISNAIDVAFNNTGSSLNSSTVQGALVEIAERMPAVFDDSENFVGLYMGNGHSKGWDVWLPDKKVLVSLDPLTGEMIENLGEGRGIYFTNNDCTGSAYIEIDYDSGIETNLYDALVVNGVVYAPNTRGTTLRTSEPGFNGLSSEMTTENTGDQQITECTVISSEASLTKSVFIGYDTLLLVEATIIDEPGVTGPLHLGTADL